MVFLKALIGLLIPITALASLHSVNTERILPAAHLTIPRAAHSATKLPNGKVLIAGGCVADGCEREVTNTAEVFDSTSGVFSRVGNMTTARVGHQAILLKTGLVLIVGGWTGQNTTAKAELFDFKTGQFTFVGNMLQERDGFTATRLQDGRILIAGGYRGAIQRLIDAEIFDPTTNQFMRVGNMNSPRMAHSAALLSDGRVLIVGGSQAKGRVVASAEIFDPTDNLFSIVSNMNVPQHKQAAVSLEDTRVLIVGGANSNDFTGQYTTTEIFDTKTYRFTSSGNMNVARFKISDSVVQLQNGQVLIAGSDRQAEVFDPDTNTFRLVQGEFDAERAYMTATRLDDGSVLIVGGYDSSIRVTDRTWLYTTK